MVDVLLCAHQNNPKADKIEIVSQVTAEAFMAHSAGVLKAEAYSRNISTAQVLVHIPTPTFESPA